MTNFFFVLLQLSTDMLYASINSFLICICRFFRHKGMVMYMNCNFCKFIIDVIVLLVVKNDTTICNAIVILLKLLYSRTSVGLNRVVMLRGMAHCKVNLHFSGEMLASSQLSGIHMSFSFFVGFKEDSNPKTTGYSKSLRKLRLGMRPLIDLLQSFETDVRVNFRRRKATVTKHFANGPEICTMIEQMCRKGMA